MAVLAEQDPGIQQLSKTGKDRRKLVKFMVSAGSIAATPGGLTSLMAETAPRIMAAAIAPKTIEAAAVIGKGGFVTAVIGAVALEGPGAAKNPPTDPEEIRHGSLEDRVNAPDFINVFQKAHFNLLRQTHLENPYMGDELRRLYLVAKEVKDRTGLAAGFGELTLNSYRRHLEMLNDPRTKVAEDVNRTLEAGHLATYTMSAFSTLAWFKLKEMKALGVVAQNVDPKTHVSEIVWGPNGIGSLYPRFFGTRGAYDIPGLEPAEQGRERIMHVGAHFFIDFMDNYYLVTKHNMGGAVPNFRRALQTARNINDMVTSFYSSDAAENLKKSSDLARRDSRSFSKILGDGYEVYGTFFPFPENAIKSARAIILREPSREGLPDKHYDEDQKANNLGRLFGDKFFNVTFRGEDPEDLTRMMDAARYKRKDSESELKLPGAK